MDWDEYKSKFVEALSLFSFDREIISILKNSSIQEKRIFVCGNGGSASISNHITSDFSRPSDSNIQNEKNRFRVISLTNSIEFLTAISNDISYDEVFKQQLMNLASDEDILILISSSGNSPNMVKVAEYAKSRNIITICFTGFDGGRLREICDFSAYVNVNQYEISEDIHMMFGHFLALNLRNISIK